MQRAIAISIAVHVVLGVVGKLTVPHGGAEKDAPELIDVTIAPPKPEVEALPEEHEGGSGESGSGEGGGSDVNLPAHDEVAANEWKAAGSAGSGAEDERIPVAMDAGVSDAPEPVDAALAVIDASPPDSRLAVADAAVPDAATAAVAVADAAPAPDAAAVAVAEPDAAPAPAPDAAAVAVAAPDAAAVAVAEPDAAPAPAPAPDAAAVAVAAPDAAAVAVAEPDAATVAVAPDDATAVASNPPDASPASEQTGSNAVAVTDPRPSPDRDRATGSNGTGSNGTGSGATGSNGTGSGAMGSGAMGSGTGSGGMGSGEAGTGSGGTGTGTGTGHGHGSGSGSDAETDVGVDGAKTSPGTAANLVSYFPTGHVVTVLVRFDRLRKTEWADAAEKILKPLPDYQTLFDPSHPAKLADKLDLLVISSPRPKDVVATTLVAKTNLSRSSLRQLLTFKTADGDSVTWSTAKAGLLGTRKHVYAHDKRVIVSPFKGWFVLGQPADMPALTATTGGDLDTVEATVRLPAWLDGIRAIEKESGDKAGPSLVVTLVGTVKRYTLPDYGLGVTELPGPERISLAMELVKQGWVIRGNIKMRSEADAKELVEGITKVKQRITDSRILKRGLEHMNAFNVIDNLSVASNGDRVSYATSISIADARALMALAGQQLDAYFTSLKSP